MAEKTRFAALTRALADRVGRGERAAIGAQGNAAAIGAQGNAKA